MKTIEFECETITPMFLAGADGKTPEIRPPSIKGAMRFWWRAMNAHLSINELRKREAEIFGGSGGNEGRSKVIIRIKTDKKLKINTDLKSGSNLKFWYSKDKHGLFGKDAGIGYLLYSTMQRDSKPYFQDSQSFVVEIKSNSFATLNHAIVSFWSLVYLGGIGTRARRGAGNITVTKIKDRDNILKELKIDFLAKGKDSSSVSDWLISNFKTASQVVNEGKETNFVSEFSNLSISRFIISKNSFSDWKEALNDIGGSFQSFRTKNKGDVFGTAVFGLPRKHIKVKGTSSKNIQRRSSPLIIKLLKVEGKYYWMALRMAGLFLPEGVVMKDDNETDKPNYSKFDEFWRIIKKDNIEKLLSIPSTVEKLKLRIEKELIPNKIILFGSKARGDFHNRSDTDIAVLTDKNIQLCNIAGAVDLIDLKHTREDFKKKIYDEGIII